MPTKSTKIDTYKDAPRVGSAAAAKQRTIGNKAAFLKAYEAIGTITGAAAQISIDRTLVYQWFEKDAEFGAAFKHSQERAVDLAEQELRRRGIAGYDKPVFQGGRRVGLIREYSDACLIFYLKGRRREVFGDKHELTGKDGEPLQAAVVVYKIPDNGRDPEMIQSAPPKKAKR